MDNLTLSLKVFKPHTIDPLEGHTVVIFETVGNAGEEFRFEIEPGQAVPKTRRGLFETLRGRKPPNYFAYAVTGLPELRWTFTADVTLDIQAHNFTLLVALAYHIGEPRLLVTRRNDDPIQKVRAHISGLLTREFAQRTWSDICYGFRQVERDVVAATIGSVRQFAAYFGIQVHELSLSHRLDEKDFRHILADEEAEAAKAAARRGAETARVQNAETALTDAQQAEFEHERARKEQERQQELSMQELHHVVDRRSHDLLLASYRRDDLVNDGLAEAIAVAIKTAANPDDLLHAISKLRGAADRVAISGGAPEKLIGAGSNGQRGAAAVVAEAFGETEGMGFDRAQKQKLQSAILHLVAELLLDGDGSDATVAKYAGHIDDLRHEPKLAKTHADYLKKFVTGDVRDELR